MKKTISLILSALLIFTALIFAPIISSAENTVHYASDEISLRDITLLGQNLKDLTIILTGDIYLSYQLYFENCTNIIIDGQGLYMITAAPNFDVNSKKYGVVQGQERHLITISNIVNNPVKSNMTFKDITLKTGSMNRHLLNVTSESIVKLINVKLDQSEVYDEKGGSALNINSSEITVAGNLDIITGPTSWHGIDIGCGSVGNSASLDFEPNVTFTYSGNEDITPINISESAGKTVEILNPENANLQYDEDGNISFAVTSIDFDESEITLFIDDAPMALSYTYAPANASINSIEWSSSDDSIVSVDADGNIKALSEGVAVITLIMDDISSSVTVTSKYYTDGIALTPTMVFLRKNTNTKLNVLRNPQDDKTPLAWSSSNTSVATVDENGNVFAVSEGVAIITVECRNYSASCEVLVGNLTLDKETYSLNVNMRVTLEASLDFDYDGDLPIVWKSSDTNVALVDQNGVVSAIRQGEVTITATISGTKISDSCTIYIGQAEKTQSIIDGILEFFRMIFEFLTGLFTGGSL